MNAPEQPWGGSPHAKHTNAYSLLPPLDTKPELYSGKHHTTGVNLQVACALTGHLAWISPPLPGSVHDAKAIKESEFLTTLNESHSGDKEAYSQTA